MRRASVCSFSRFSLAFSVVWLDTACGGRAQAPVSGSPAPQGPTTPVLAASSERPGATPHSTQDDSRAHDPKANEATASRATVTISSFPPKDFPPPSEKSAAPGDGHWTPFGDAALGERAAAEPRAVVRTVVHPHPESRFITVTIAAMDLERLAVHLVPGTEDLTWAKLPAESGGLVPASDRDALVLVMNGGFQPKHGRWGLAASGVVVTLPRKEGCTIALYGTASVRLGPWPSLADSAGDMTSYRQTPPCLLDGGAVHPSLLKGLDKAWAGHTADLTTRRRSAIGIDATGRTLFYAIGEEASPRWIAEALRTAGATSAAELDINWYWTRFLAFGTDGGALHVTSSLIPKMEHLRTEYVERASIRDFFYVTRK
jgi:hypothetical protein